MQLAINQQMSGKFRFILDGPHTILAVDDDPLQREFCSVYLAAPQTRIVTAGSASEGLSLLEDSAFDIALIDVDMPGMSGIDMLRRIRADARFDDLPVMVITGREDMEIIDLAYQEGATAFMCKPVNWRLLSHQVKFLLRAHKAMRQTETRDD